MLRHWVNLPYLVNFDLAFAKTSSVAAADPTLKIPDGASLMNSTTGDKLEQDRQCARRNAPVGSDAR